MQRNTNRQKYKKRYLVIVNRYLSFIFVTVNDVTPTVIIAICHILLSFFHFPFFCLLFCYLLLLLLDLFVAVSPLLYLLIHVAVVSCL